MVSPVRAHLKYCVALKFGLPSITKGNALWSIFIV